MTVKSFAGFAAAAGLAAALSLAATTTSNAAPYRGTAAVAAAGSRYDGYYDYAPSDYDYAGPPAVVPTPQYQTPFYGPGWTYEWGPAYRPGCAAGEPHC